MAEVMIIKHLLSKMISKTFNNKLPRGHRPKFVSIAMQSVIQVWSMSTESCLRADSQWTHALKWMLCCIAIAVNDRGFQPGR